MMGQPFTQVDAFTSTPFGGNPAAVCILTEPGNAHWMQQVASEMNLAETAFLHRQEDGFGLRWFTPLAEADLCGHATLASAHVLWEEGHLQPGETARFYTRSGVLTAERRGAWITLDFPATPATAASAPAELVQALGGEVAYVGRNQLDYLVEVDSEETLRALKPDLNLLGGVPVRGVMVTSLSSSTDYDFVSRFFAPRVGIPEDPATGSAHCTLAPFWGERLNKSALVAYQASQRGGVFRLRVNSERIAISGQAVTALRGELLA